MRLDPQQRLRLKAVMAEAFQNYDELRRYVAEKCAIQLAAITGPDMGTAANIAALIDAAEKNQPMLDRLLDGLRQHTRLSLRSIAEQLAMDRKAALILQGLPINNPLDALFLAQRVCFIGRADLRKALHEMTGPHSGIVVLVVNGNRICGKSYTFQLLRTLERLKPDNIVVKIDFKHFIGGALAERYQDIVTAINLRMEVPRALMPEGLATEPKWFANCIQKFDVVAMEKNKLLWLVFDHVGSAGILDSALSEALARVLTYACDRSQSLRVVLIDMKPEDLLSLQEPHIRTRLAQDTAVLPDREDIKAFLQELATRIGRQLTQAELDTAANTIMAAIANYVPQANAPYAYSEITWMRAHDLHLVN